VAGPSRWPLPGPVPDAVDFRGPVPTTTAADLLLDHDVLLMPSRFEAFGIALLEGLASGMPVIGRRAYAMPELVPADRGLLVDEADAGQLAIAIDQLAADKEIWDRCFAEAMRTRAEWSWDEVAKRVLDVVTSGGPTA